MGADWYQKYASKVPELASAGLYGIEAFSSEISEENHELIKKVAIQNDLELTGGSDNHGNLKVSHSDEAEEGTRDAPLFLCCPLLFLPFLSFAVSFSGTLATLALFYCRIYARSTLLL